MIQLTYDCEKIREDKDFVRFQEQIIGKRQFCPDYKDTLIYTWTVLYNHLKPGKAPDGTVALAVTVHGEEMQLSEADADIFAERFYTGLKQAFGPYILSVVRNREEGVSCTGIVFPFYKRIPNAERFLNKNFPNLPSDAVRKNIEQTIRERFPEVFVTGDTSSQNKEHLGYMPALLSFTPAPYRKEYDHVLPYHVVNPDDQIQTMLPYDKMNQITDRVISYFTTGPEHLLFERSQKWGTDITPEIFMQKVKEHLEKNYPEVKGQDMNILLNRIYRAVFENYILEPLINADEISDIMVLAPDDIRVKIGGERYTSDLSFISAEDYDRFIRSIATRNNLDLKRYAIHVFSDTTSNPHFRMRFNLTTPYINSSEYPYLHIRKIAKKKRGLEYLIKAGMLDATLADYLIDRARNGKRMIFTGKGASGKTTLMNMLLDKIPFDKSGLVIQESAELFSDVHPHLMFQHIVTNTNNKMHYDLQDLARNGLLTDLDYFVIGEVKGAETGYLIIAVPDAFTENSDNDTMNDDRLAIRYTIVDTGDPPPPPGQAAFGDLNLGMPEYRDLHYIAQYEELPEEEEGGGEEH